MKSDGKLFYNHTFSDSSPCMQQKNPTIPFYAEKGTGKNGIFIIWVLEQEVQVNFLSLLQILLEN